MNEFSLTHTHLIIICGLTKAISVPHLVEDLHKINETNIVNTEREV